MEKYSRSNSSREGVVQPSSMNGLRSYSVSVTQAPRFDHLNNNLKKSKTTKINDTKNWNFGVDHPELQRKKRVACYKAYTVEGKMKGSVRKSFRWIKDTCNQFVHGIW
ncbi:uncharacterized protein LOC131009625 [Salvia miltiorrhiza]|uniref:uncharacterized protein LOC131009625 n=1 Tax=Salvia miltiorrhiza TaxID=226208 RepID=UPI0025AD4746|nr:uncharacterized protein LOC131009625 [Salvia miltiorrhiza]